MDFNYWRQHLIRINLGALALRTRLPPHYAGLRTTPPPHYAGLRTMLRPHEVALRTTLPPHALDMTSWPVLAISDLVTQRILVKTIYPVIEAVCENGSSVLGSCVPCVVMTRH